MRFPLHCAHGYLLQKAPSPPCAGSFLGEKSLFLCTSQPLPLSGQQLEWEPLPKSSCLKHDPLPLGEKAFGDQPPPGAAWPPGGAGPSPSITSVPGGPQNAPSHPVPTLGPPERPLLRGPSRGGHRGSPLPHFPGTTTLRLLLRQPAIAGVSAAEKNQLIMCRTKAYSRPK